MIEKRIADFGWQASGVKSVKQVVVGREKPADRDLENFYQDCELQEEQARCYNEGRFHSVWNYLFLIDHFKGEPETLLSG